MNSDVFGNIKTAAQLAAACRKVATDYKTLYVMGCFGAPMTETNKARYIKHHQYNAQAYRIKMINAADDETFGFDCVCLIKGMLWGWDGDKSHIYGGAEYMSNDVPDIAADGMFRACTEQSSDFSNIQIGEAVWKAGHIGVYIGDGLSVECTPSWKNNVQITACNCDKTGYDRRNWTKHGKLPYVTYEETPEEVPEKPYLSRGIDISKWQGEFDMAKAQNEGFKFAIIKGGGGDVGLYTDKQFANNYKKAKALGMPVGSYWFTKATSVKAAIEEADYYYKNCLMGRQFELPIYLDVEGSMLKLNKRLLNDIVRAWCQRIEEKGYFVGIYSGIYSFRDLLDEDITNHYVLWLAQYAKTRSYSHKNIGMWQYGGETNYIRSNKVAGVTCDQDYMFVDYPSIIKTAKLNGFGEPESAETKPAETVQTNSYPTIRSGSTGTYVKKAQEYLNKHGASLNVDSVFGALTLAAVKKFQKEKGLDVDGVVGPKTWVALEAEPKVEEFKSYSVRVTSAALNVRSGPGMNYGINTCIRDKGTYTIVAESNGWGKLKPGAGWINLDYTKRV